MVAAITQPPRTPGGDPAKFTTVPDLARYFRMRIQRASFTNLDDAVEHKVLLNPTEFREKYKPNYVRLESPGLSHQRLQFSHCDNVKIPLTLFFDQLLFATNQGSNGISELATGQEREVEEWRRRLISYTYPRQSQQISAASPPQVLFVWPGTIAMVVRVVSLEFHHTTFEIGSARPRVFLAEVELEEDLQQRVYADDIVRDGTRRPWTSNYRRRR